MKQLIGITFIASTLFCTVNGMEKRHFVIETIRPFLTPERLIEAKIKDNQAQQSSSSAEKNSLPRGEKLPTAWLNFLTLLSIEPTDNLIDDSVIIKATDLGCGSAFSKFLYHLVLPNFTTMSKKRLMQQLSIFPIVSLRRFAFFMTYFALQRAKAIRARNYQRASERELESALTDNSGLSGKEQLSIGTLGGLLSHPLVQLEAYLRKNIEHCNWQGVFNGLKSLHAEHGMYGFYKGCIHRSLSFGIAVCWFGALIDFFKCADNPIIMQKMLNDIPNTVHGTWITELLATQKNGSPENPPVAVQ